MAPGNDLLFAGVIPAWGKLRNGLYLHEIAIASDAIEFRVFASRPFAADDLSEMTLRDDVGTAYEMVAPDVLDGRGVVAFKPAPPPGASGLTLAQPGWGLVIFNDAAT